VVLEDSTSSMEMLCFSRVLEKYGGYLQENQVIAAKGRLSVRDEKAPQLMVDAVDLLRTEGDVSLGSTKKETTTAGKTLYLRFPGLESREFEHAKLVFTMFPGKSPVKMRMADTGKLLGTQCLIHDALVQEMKEVLGEENVVVK